MALPYYVEPEYWAEGYAEGDAKLVAATVQPSLSATTTVLNVRNAASVVAAQLAATAQAQIIFLASALASPSLAIAPRLIRVQSVTTGENYYVVDGYWETGYVSLDDGTVTTRVSADRVRLSSATSACSGQLATAIDRVRLGSAAVSASTTTTILPFVIANAIAQISPVLVTAAAPRLTASAKASALPELQTAAKMTATFAGKSNIVTQFDFATTVNLVRPTSASTSINAILAANARLKWETQDDTPETWTTIADTSSIWTDVPDTSETWTEI